MFISEAIRTDMKMIETIRSIIVGVFFLVIAPVLGVLAAFTHDRRYDELLDDW